MNGLKNQNNLYQAIVEKIRKIRLDPLTKTELIDATYEKVFAYACESVACKHCLNPVDLNLEKAIAIYKDIGINVEDIVEIRGENWCFIDYKKLGILFKKRFSRSMRTIFKYAGYPVSRDFIEKRKIRWIDKEWDCLDVLEIRGKD